MQIFIVVPFLIGMKILDVPAEEANLKLSYEYNYEVHMTSDFHQYGSDGMYEKRNDTLLSLNFLCSDVQHESMMCYIEPCNEIQPTPRKNLESQQLLYMAPINPSVFYRNSVPFKIMFGAKGIDGYIVERRSVPKQLMNIYRSIANQLSIGFNINDTVSKTFKLNERSNVADCPTRYEISVESSRAKRNIVLVPLVNLDFQKGMTVISKQRIISECFVTSNYSFSAGIWPEFVPKAAKVATLVHTSSWIHLSAHEIKSETTNIFNFYNQSNYRVGFVRERVNLELKSYRNISPVHIPVINKFNTVELDIFNDNVL
ncbi:uncharacterized protein LOC105181150 [Harpegnathos saltator]|uniref:uncharacterized protein LOC105181150 n=1 Tax=Harpegnathos saltator TaxID=610380 RepID=UPI000DBEE2A4|nr:uncharacterized protein LOC105181150 [Harpegnathos saltator]XP_011136038.2 uncharacterized protein LOC105181150 [Harpegnathos saltator]